MEHPEFWLISSSQNDPILGPQFPPSVRSIGGPISLPILSPDLIPSCTLSVALAGRATRGNDANFGDFGIMTPLDEHILP